MGWKHNLLCGCADVTEQQQAWAEIERLQAIVDKLPKTADGVPMVPGMEVWQLQTQNAGKTWSVVSRQVDKVFWPYAGWLRRRCFSTREVAEKAEEGE